MQLSEELQAAAESLGKQLSAEPVTAKYLKLEEEFRLDPQASQLEQNFLELYETLLGRQQAGEAIDQADYERYLRLQNEVETHPLISAREAQFEQVKGLFAQTAQRLTDTLGIDYPSFAQQ